MAKRMNKRLAYAVMRAGADSEDEAHGFGPFYNRDKAEQFASDYGEIVLTGYTYLVVELVPPWMGAHEIREEKRQDGW